MDWLMAGTSPAFITICYKQRVPAKRQLTERPERPKNPKSAHHLLTKLPVDRWRQMERVIPLLSPFRPINSIVHWLIGTSVHKLQVENWTFSRLIVCELKSGGRGGGVRRQEVSRFPFSENGSYRPDRVDARF